jgi:hypothetical protein
MGDHLAEPDKKVKITICREKIAKAANSLVPDQRGSIRPGRPLFIDGTLKRSSGCDILINETMIDDRRRGMALRGKLLRVES